MGNEVEVGKNVFYRFDLGEWEDDGVINWNGNNTDRRIGLGETMISLVLVM